jgi:hypothetical protein
VVIQYKAVSSNILYEDDLFRPALSANCRFSLLCHQARLLAGTGSEGPSLVIAKSEGAALVLARE